jgi:hypothetical protein
MVALHSGSAAAIASQIWHFLQMHALTLGLAYVLLKLLYNRYGSPLRKYPGPFLASCSRLWQGKNRRTTALKPVTDRFIL